MADRFRRSSLIGPIRFFQDIARQGLLLDYAFFFFEMYFVFGYIDFDILLILLRSII